MAGHKISGYMSSIWQALFASFIQLFTRIFRFTTGTTSTSKQQSASGTSPDSHQSFSPNPPHQASANQYHNTSDLEEGLPVLDETMAASKKRGGQKRTAVKTNGANAAAPTTQQQKDKENLGAGKLQSNQNQPSAPLLDSRNAPVNTLAPGGKNAASKQQQPDGQKPNSFKPFGKNRGRASGRSSPTKQLTDNQKDAAIASGRETPKVNGPQTPLITAVVPTENKSEVQKSGSHIQTATQAPDPTTKSTKEKIPPRDAQQVDQAITAIDQLTLNDKSNAAPKEQPLNKDTAAVEAAAVPSVTAIPYIKPPILPAPKPLAPLVTPPSQVLPGLIEPETEEGKIEREYHLKFMREALGMGSLALSTNETPVGCVLVYRGRTIAKGMNATNVTRNGTRHAEFMALSALLSHQPDADVKHDSTLDESNWGDVDPSDGHIYPYGQKLHPSPKVNRSIISECVLYVTVEPCVMCASLLRQLGIKKVYFGAVNDKFGGTGGVFRIHLNSKPVPRPEGREYQNGYGPHDVDRISRGRAAPAPRDEYDGDGGNVESGFPVEGGYLRDEAVSLLRRFYVQENGRAPQPRKKEGRAARLFAIENQTGGGLSDLSDGALAPDTPVDTEPTFADQEQFPLGGMTAAEAPKEVTAAAN